MPTRLRSRPAAARMRGLFLFPGPIARSRRARSPLFKEEAMHRDALFARYTELSGYVGWTETDAALVRSIGPPLQPYFDAIVDDFYQEIDRHPGARKVLTGGEAQAERLKMTLRRWIGDLFV